MTVISNTLKEGMEISITNEDDDNSMVKYINVNTSIILFI